MGNNIGTPKSKVMKIPLKKPGTYGLPFFIEESEIDYQSDNDEETKIFNTPSSPDLKKLDKAPSFISTNSSVSEALGEEQKTLKAKKNYLKVEIPGFDQIQDLTSPIVIPSNSDLYKKTHYFKYFDSTPRYPSLKEAVDDLASIFASTDNGKSTADAITNYYKVHGSKDKAKCVTLIWTSDRRITDLINCALVIDAISLYEYDKKMFKYYFDKLDELKVDYTLVISKSIKFIRILNSSIVDKGTPLNTSKRVTYRGIHKSIIPNVKVGQTFRVVNWMCTSESLDIAKSISTHLGKDRLIVQ